MTSVETISRWFDKGKSNDNEFMIVVCDTYDHSDYPVFCSADDFKKDYQGHSGVNMQKIMEVYDLSMSKKLQLSERRAFHFPAGFNPANNKINFDKSK